MAKQSAIFLLILGLLFNLNVWTMTESDIEEESIRRSKGKEKIVEGEEAREVLILARNDTSWVLNAEGKDQYDNILFQIRLASNEISPIGEYENLIKNGLKVITFKSAGKIKKYTGAVYPYQVDAISYAILKQKEAGKPLLPLLLVSVGYSSGNYFVDLKMLADQSSLDRIIHSAEDVWAKIEEAKEGVPSIPSISGIFGRIVGGEKTEVAAARQFLGILGEVKYDERDIRDAVARLLLVGKFARIFDGSTWRDITAKGYEENVNTIGAFLTEQLEKRPVLEPEEIESEEEVPSETEKMKESVEIEWEEETAKEPEEMKKMEESVEIEFPEEEKPEEKELRESLPSEEVAPPYPPRKPVIESEKEVPPPLPPRRPVVLPSIGEVSIPEPITTLPEVPETVEEEEQQKPKKGKGAVVELGAMRRVIEEREKEGRLPYETKKEEAEVEGVKPEEWED